MTDQKLSGLPAITPIDTTLFYGVNSPNVTQGSVTGLAMKTYIGSGTPGGATTNVQYNDAGVFGGDANFTWDKTGKSLTITSNSATAVSLGPSGNTNPAFQVDASTASSATGIQVKSAAAAGGIAIKALSSGTDEALTLDAKGAGTMTIQPTATGAWTIGNNSAASSQFNVGSGNIIRMQYAGTTKHSFSTTQVLLQPNVSTGNAAVIRFSYISAADGGLTASTEAPNVYFSMGQIRTHSTGALTLQRDFRITGSTHAASGASVFTDVAVFSIDGASTAGTNATITNSHAIYIPAASVSGTGVVTNAYGLTINAPSGAANNYAANFNGLVRVNSLPNMQIVAAITGLNAKATANTLALTNSTGRTLVVTGTTVRCSAATAITVGPTVSVGTTAGAGDIFAPISLTALTTTADMFGFGPVGASKVVPNAGTVYFNITVAATGTSQTIEADVAGYYV